MGLLVPPLTQADIFQRTCLQIQPQTSQTLGPHAKFQNTGTPPSGRQVTTVKRKEGREKYASIGVHFVLPATPKGAHAL